MLSTFLKRQQMQASSINEGFVSTNFESSSPLTFLGGPSSTTGLQLGRMQSSVQYIGDMTNYGI
jgi:hypothetical protein